MRRTILLTVLAGLLLAIALPVYASVQCVEPKYTDCVNACGQKWWAFISVGVYDQYDACVAVCEENWCYDDWSPCAWFEWLTGWPCY